MRHEALWPRAGPRNRSLRLFYFHLEALQTSLIHPKFMDDQLVSSLSLIGLDVDYAVAITEFVDHCSGTEGAPTKASRRTVILHAIENLRGSVPPSQSDYRFSHHELNQLEAVVTSMSD